MNDRQNARGKSRWIPMSALLVGGAIAGATLAGTVTAMAQSGSGSSLLAAASSTTGTTSTSGSTGTSSTGTSGTTTPTCTPAWRNGFPGHRSDETDVTGTKLTTLRAAAVKAVPGGTILRVETDSGDATYEAHMRKSDGSLVTVKFDKNLRVTKVEAGMGLGDPRGPR